MPPIRGFKLRLIPRPHIVGEANEQTRNLVILDDGLRAHLRCGADILLSGLYQDVRGEAICPICGNKVSLVVDARRVVSLEPESALLHYVVENQRIFSIRCSSTFIFDRESCLKTWLESYKGNPGSVVSLPGFMAQAVSRRTPPDAIAASCECT